MTRSSRLVIALGVVLLALAALYVGARRTAPSLHSDPLELLPARCEGVLVVPDLGRLGEHVARIPRLKLAELLAGLAGYATADAFLDELARQLGADPRSRGSLRAVGIDPSRPLVAYAPQPRAALFAIPESDAGALDALLERNAAHRLGATRRSNENVGGRTLISAFGEGQTAPSLTWLHAGGYVFLAQGALGPSLLETVMLQSPEGSLARDPRFAAARQAMSGRDLFGYRCEGSSASQPMLRGLPPGSSFAASLAAKDARLSVHVPLSDGQAAAVASLAAPAGADLVGQLDSSAFLIARFGGDPMLLRPVVDALLPKAFQKVLAQGGFDVGADVLGNLKPGIAGSLNLSPSVKLGGVPALDARRTNPFDYVTISILGRTADAAKADQSLKKLVLVAPRFGASMEEHTIEGTRVIVATYPLGEGASFALKGDRALVTGGKGQMESQLKRLQAPTSSALADPDARRALQEDAFMIYLDVGKLTAGLRALPDSAYGIGGFALKAAALRWVDALDTIASVRLNGRIADKALDVELALTLAHAHPAAGPAP